MRVGLSGKDAVEICHVTAVGLQGASIGSATCRCVWRIPAGWCMKEKEDESDLGKNVHSSQELPFHEA